MGRDEDLRDLPERHRSLNAIFDSSWARLDEIEQRLLAALAVFRGTFDRDAVQAVAGTSLKTLTRLVNKSLLRRNPSGRYEQHELLRQYAKSKLSSTALGAARDSHARHYSRHTQQQEKRCRGSEQVEALRDMEREIDNIRAAWEWCLESRKWLALSDLLEGLYRFHDMKGLFQLGEALFRHAAETVALDAPDQEREILRAKLLSRQGRFVFQLGEFARARDLLEASVSVLRATNTRRVREHVLKGGTPMAKILRCKHIGPDTSCEFEAKGETEQDILSQVKDHAAKAHHIHEITPELVQQAKANMQDV